MNEIWKDVKGYEKLYSVSNEGRVKNKYTGKILKPSNDKDGYLLLGLRQNKKTNMKRVHRLVAEAFINNDEHKPQVNHIDGNKINNCVNNLEWCTDMENKHHAYKTGLYSGKKRSGYISKGKTVEQYDISGVLIAQWRCIREASKNLKIDGSSISKACIGKLKTAGGYVWKYC